MLHYSLTFIDEVVERLNGRVIVGHRSSNTERLNGLVIMGERSKMD